MYALQLEPTICSRGTALFNIWPDLLNKVSKCVKNKLVTADIMRADADGSVLNVLCVILLFIRVATSRWTSGQWDHMLVQA